MGDPTVPSRARSLLSPSLVCCPLPHEKMQTLDIGGPGKDPTHTPLPIYTPQTPTHTGTPTTTPPQAPWLLPASSGFWRPLVVICSQDTVSRGSPKPLATSIEQVPFFAP